MSLQMRFGSHAMGCSESRRAGGISSLGDLVKLSKMGVEASVIGKAIYTGDIQLSEALQKVV